MLLPTVPLGLTVPRRGPGPAEHRCGHGGRQSFGVSRFLGSVDFWGRQIFGVTALRCHQQLSPSGVPPCLARVPALSLFNSLLKLISPFGSGRSQRGWNRLLLLRWEFRAGQQRPGIPKVGLLPTLGCST